MPRASGKGPKNLPKRSPAKGPRAARPKVKTPAKPRIHNTAPAGPAYGGGKKGASNNGSPLIRTPKVRVTTDAANKKSMPAPKKAAAPSKI